MPSVFSEYAQMNVQSFKNTNPFSESRLLRSGKESKRNRFCVMLILLSGTSWMLTTG